jgi:hypothetical protein
MADASDADPDYAGLLALRERDVDGLLSSSKPVDALLRSLQNPPFASKDDALKERSLLLVLRALSAVGSRDEALAKFFEALDADVADVLMKNVLKGFNKPENSALLLRIHALLVEKAGIACVVRAIVDRKTA